VSTKSQSLKRKMAAAASGLQISDAQLAIADAKKHLQ